MLKPRTSLTNQPPAVNLIAFILIALYVIAAIILTVGGILIFFGRLFGLMS